VTRPLRVVHCPVNTAGVPWANTQALRRRGVDASLVVFNRYLLHPELAWGTRMVPPRAPSFAASSTTAREPPGRMNRPPATDRCAPITE
jgi:hypothetical protein